MSGGSSVRITRMICRLAVVLGACLIVAGLVGGVAEAASTPVPPTVTRTEATYVIPSTKGHVIWEMKLWTCSVTAVRCSGTLLGTTSGVSGELTLSVPPVSDCTYQANILHGHKLYVLQHVTFSPCTTSPPTTSTTKPSHGSTTTTSTTRVITTSTTAKARGSTTGSTSPATGGTSGTGDARTTSSDTHLAFTGAGFMLKALGVFGGLLVFAGFTVLWYVRPRRPRTVI
jgi:hypothetical protein